MISIHAPMKDATNDRRHIKHQEYNFNPRTHEGCDRSGLKMIRIELDFNPRTHEGCDTHAFFKFQHTLISIHAPMKDATCRFCNSRFPFLFQSTHP